MRRAGRSILLLALSLLLSPGCGCLTSARITRTLPPIEGAPRFGDPGPTTIRLSTDELDPSRFVLRVTRTTPVSRDVRRPTTTVWTRGKGPEAPYFTFADSILTFPIDAVVSLAYGPHALLSSDRRVDGGPLGLLLAVLLPFNTVYPAGFVEPPPWELEALARSGTDTVFAPLPPVETVEDVPLSGAPVRITCDGAPELEVWTDRSGGATVPGDYCLEAARARRADSTTLVVRCAGAEQSFELDSDALAALAEAGARRGDPGAVEQRRLALRAQRFTVQTTSPAGVWSRWSRLPGPVPLQVRVRCEVPCDVLWKWRAQLRNDSATAVTLSWSLMEAESEVVRLEEPLTIEGGGEGPEEFFFVTAAPHEPVVVTVGELDP